MDSALWSWLAVDRTESLSIHNARVFENMNTLRASYKSYNLPTYLARSEEAQAMRVYSAFILLPPRGTNDKHNVKRPQLKLPP